MRSRLTLRLVLIAALLFSLVRVAIVHAAHVGMAEWLVVTALIVVLVVAMLRSPRRTI
jgi:hypothetical protein